jgi:hypothetical protein
VLDRLSLGGSGWSLDTSVPPPRRLSVLVVACLAVLGAVAFWSLGKNGDLYLVSTALALALEGGLSLWWWRARVAAGRPPRNRKLRVLSFIGAAALLLIFWRLADPPANPSSVVLLLFLGFVSSVIQDELITRREIAAAP